MEATLLQTGKAIAMSDILLVTGTSGHFGRRVLDYLMNILDVSPERIVATTRKPAGLADLALGMSRHAL
jgi:uncharacterized protein YbjT (DUF2867 family)